MVSCYVLLLAVGATNVILRSNDVSVHNIAIYIFILMAVLRNEHVWNAFYMFLHAAIAAGPVAYLFVCMLLVIAAMSTALLHDRYGTDDFQIDFQYHNTVNSLTTMFIYLSTGELPAILLLAVDAHQT